MLRNYKFCSFNIHTDTRNKKKIEFIFVTIRKGLHFLTQKKGFLGQWKAIDDRENEDKQKLKIWRVANPSQSKKITELISSWWKLNCCKCFNNFCILNEIEFSTFFFHLFGELPKSFQTTHTRQEKWNNWMCVVVCVFIVKYSDRHIQIYNTISQMKGYRIKLIQNGKFNRCILLIEIFARKCQTVQ